MADKTDDFVVFNHKKGDRVKRRVDVYNPDSEYRTGTIIDIYSYTSSDGWRYPRLYRVQWDDGKIEEGYLNHGIQPIDWTPTEKT